MQRTGILALGAALLTLSFVPQADAAISVGGAQRAAASDVHAIGFARHDRSDRLWRWFDHDRKDKGHKHYKRHKKHRKHKH